MVNAIHKMDRNTALWLRNANIPLRFLGTNLPDLDPYKLSNGDDPVVRIRAWATAVAEGKVVQAQGSPSCGKGLRLLGLPGQGKTTLACAVLQHLAQTVPNGIWLPGRAIRHKHPVYYATYPEILRLFQATFNDNDADEGVLLKQIFGEDPQDEYNIKVLVIDDLGKEHHTASGWAVSMFDHLLRRRFDVGLPTIVTSNVLADDWEGVYGAAMASFALEALVAYSIVSPTGDRRNK